MTVSKVLAQHPQIKKILDKFRIDCVKCGSSSCLLKNVLGQHVFDPNQARQMEKEVNEYFSRLGF